jgi:secondary thiamine-phosphate synthase enzyme
MWQQHEMTLQTRGRGFQEITPAVDKFVHQAGMSVGLCHLFLRHTSAGLCITENADAGVRSDLERLAQRLVPDGDVLFHHDTEGPDDMPAHVRNLLFGCELTIPVREGRLALGTWQGIYLWEHRVHSMQRHIVVTLYGTP